MKTIILASCIIIGLSGCVYDEVKPIYKAGKQIVKVSPITDKTRERLKRMDQDLTTYDNVRNLVKPQKSKDVTLD